MDGKFGCCYKLRSCTQIDNAMNIVILHLLEIAGIIENKERERNQVIVQNIVPGTQASYY